MNSYSSPSSSSSAMGCPPASSGAAECAPPAVAGSHCDSMSSSASSAIGCPPASGGAAVCAPPGCTSVAGSHCDSMLSRARIASALGTWEEQTLTGESCSIAPAPACSARATPDDCDAACVAGSSAGSTPSSSSPLPHRACRSRAAACAPRRCDCTSARFAACSAAATSR